jgi:hypothetical protein
VEACRSIDVNRLEREGCLRAGWIGGWQWTLGGERVASITLRAEHGLLHLTYRMCIGGADWEDVAETVRIVRATCRFGGTRPYFICPGVVNRVACGRRVAKLYSGGRLFACRHCCGLGYAAQRGGPMDRAHNRLARLHRKLGADYDSPDMPAPPKPKWMRWKTYSRIAQQIEARQEQLDVVFMAGAQRILTRVERTEHQTRRRRWRRHLRRLR